MLGKHHGWWVVLGLLLGCGLAPSEVVDVYDGPGSSSSGGGSTAGQSGVDDRGSTGPVADGAASSSTGTPEATGSEGNATEPVDPDTTAPGTDTGTTSEVPPDPSTTTDDPPDPSTGDVSCDAMYGGAAGYHLCEETGDSCRFNVDVMGVSNCTAVCTSFGGTCIDALDNPGPGMECVVQGDLDCNFIGKGTTLCICSK
jgi:hypothetical protein